MAYSHTRIDKVDSVAHGGVPPQELLDFRQAIERNVRGAKTLARTQTTAYVYVEGNPMAMGWVGFGDFQTSVAGEKKYVMYARDITNNKYADHSEARYMRMSVNIDTAIKYAKQFFRPYTTPEIASAVVEPVSKAVNEVQHNIKNKYYKAASAVGIEAGSYRNNCAPLLSELMRMVQGGHTFVDQEVDHNVRDLIQAYEMTLKASRNDKTPMDFVHIYERYGKQYVDRVRVSDVRSTYGLFRGVAGDVETWLATLVPEDIQGKAAVMSMCADEQYVDGVGYKISDTMFYFCVEDVTL